MSPYELFASIWLGVWLGYLWHVVQRDRARRN